MKFNRRRFIRSGIGAGVLATMHSSCSAADSRKAGLAQLDEAAAAPILKLYSVIPHMSGEGVGCVDVLQFASCTPNIGAFHEYKGGLPQTGAWYDPPLRLKDGDINVPTGPGLGITPQADILKDAKPLE